MASPRFYPFAYLLLIFISIQSETYFKGWDAFGFFFGYYGLVVQYPLNMIVASLIILLIVLFGKLLGFILVHKLEMSGHTATLIGIHIALVLYASMIKTNYLVSLFFDIGILLILFQILSRIQNRSQQVERSLISNYKMLYAVIAFISIVGILNYYRWIIRGFDIHTSYGFKSLLLVFVNGNSQFLPHYFDFAPYIYTEDMYAEFYYLGLLISIIVRSLVLILITQRVWRINSYHIDQISAYPRIFRIVLEEEKEKIVFSESNESRAPDKYHINKAYAINFDSIEIISDLILSEMRLLFHVSNSSSDLRIEIISMDSVIEKGSTLSNLLHISEPADQSEKIPILLVQHQLNSFLLRIPIESVYFHRFNKFIPLSSYYVPIRQFYSTSSSLRILKKRKILFIHSSEVSSLLLKRKVDKLLAGSDSQLIPLPLSKIEDLHKLAQITKEKIDLAIVILHGSNDENSSPYFVLDENPEYILNSEKFLKFINVMPSMFIIPSCVSISPGNKDLPETLIENGCSYVLGSVSNVLSSHLPFIVLTFIENWLKLSEFSLFAIHAIHLDIQKLVIKFGFELQWSSFRHYTILA